MNIQISLKLRLFKTDFFNFTYDRSLSKNKNFEFQTFFDPNWLFHFELNTDSKGFCHAGPSLTLALFGLWACIQIYDSRHWDYENDKFEEHE